MYPQFGRFCNITLVHNLSNNFLTSFSQHEPLNSAFSDISIEEPSKMKIVFMPPPKPPRKILIIIMTRSV